MKKYKNYLIAAGILIVGIILGSVFTGNKTPTVVKDGEHEYVQDPVTKLWTCAMHPQIKMQEPGNCPICGMELIPLTDDNDDIKEKISEDEIVLGEDAIQLANIQTSKVVKSNAIKEIHLLGKVQPDERKLYSQVSHIPGRIEQLYVNFTGEKISFGQKIVRIYSPELILAQKELFEAIISKDIYPQLYTAARNKLKLWKLNDSQIDAIEASGKVQEEIDILSDHSGYVMKRAVELGDYVKEGSVLFKIANLSSVWVMFEAYESDIQWIHINNVFNFTIQALPGKTFKGKVTYVDPFVSAATRVAKVRVEVNNFSNTLLPEMYATGIVSAKLANVKDAIMIPKSAVLWTGKRAVVYVKVPHEKIHSFMYREVTLGADLGDYYIIEDGLMEGETVATNGVFRIDASAQLLSKKSMMNPKGESGTGGGMANMPGMNMGGSTSQKEDEKKTKPVVSKSLSVDKQAKEALQSLYALYLNWKDALTNDDFAQAQKSATNMKLVLDKINMSLFKGDVHNSWMDYQGSLSKSLEHVPHFSDIEQLRKTFITVSNTMIEMTNTYTPLGKTIYVQHCPMADNNKGADWLSLEKEIKNPYFGASMLKCGEIKQEIK